MQIFADKEELLEPLSREDKGELMDALFAYAFHDTEIPLETNARFVWPIFRQMLDQSRKSLEAKSNARKGKTANQTESNDNQSESKPNQNESDHNQNVSDTNQTESNDHINKNQESRIKIQDTRDIVGANAPTTRARARGRDESNPLSALAPEVQTAFRDFIAMRVKMRKPLTDRAITLNVNKLLSIAGNDPATQVAVINQTVEHCWQGFYPLKSPEELARSGTTAKPAKRVAAQEYTQREYSGQELDQLFEVL